MLGLRHSLKLVSTRRSTDLPYPKWLGFGIKGVKSIEVVLFKLLEILRIYRAQKSIVAIPSLATPNFTSLQATVYNGKQEEVLGYKPRRFYFRLLRGIPDVETFEKLRFQLTVSDKTTRTVEASTETRGFIHLQLPWQLPWTPPKLAWVRIQPRGVETLFGRIRLGDYEIFSAPVYFLTPKTRWIIISDIDDTIKDSKILETTGMKQILGGIIKGHYYTFDPIQGMAELYQELARQGALIIYLTSTPYQLTPFLLKFLKQCGFPEGPVFMRWLGYGRVRHKWRTLIKILSNLGPQKVFLIGDSGESDLPIYRRICETKQFSKHVEKILIRHLPGTPVPKTLNEREQVYRTLDDLKKELAPALRS